MQKLLLALFLFAAIPVAHAQQFVHPGIDQRAEDLAFMKRLVERGVSPYKDAFERLRTSIDEEADVKAHAHVLRGPYGKPNIGGNELSKGAHMAYNCALLWYITGERQYADKAMAVLNDWSATLWDFDYNDAKLLAAWTGHMLCNAAEILRYSNAGWKQKDMDRFSQMLMTVYYPLMRYYYPQANGNWDGAIIHSILAMAVYLDNREMFDNAIDHFLHGPVNGSIFKYIYPSGQCQESMRDQAHVQLGLGEFAGAAQIAYTQGVDLFAIADNRIGLGYEYTAAFLLGDTPHCYGPISERAKVLRDDYELVYRHYAAQGVKLPYTKRAADSVRAKATRSVLTSVRLMPNQLFTKTATPKAGTIGYIAGAGAREKERPPAGAIIVNPGESLQDALNTAAGKGHWVLAKAGLHKFPATLRMPSGVTLAGEGIATILMLDPSSGMRDAIVNAEPDMHDVTVRDLVLEGGEHHLPHSDPNSVRSFRNRYNRGGILFRGQTEGQMKNLQFINLTVQHCTFTGLLVSGAADVKVIRCDLNENGVSVAPGFNLLHNLHLTHCKDISIMDSRMATSPLGAGIALADCRNAAIERCEVARNGYYGVLLTECSRVSVAGNLVEGNDRSGIMLEYLHRGVQQADIRNNLVHYNAGYGIESHAAEGLTLQNNTCTGNGQDARQELVNNDRYILMK